MAAPALDRVVRREIGFDALRVLAALGVIGVHVTSFRAMAVQSGAIAWDVESLVNALLNSIVVPLFVFLAALFSWGRPYEGGRGSYPRFVGRRFIMLVVPYVAWSAVFVAAFPGPVRDALATEGRIAAFGEFASVLWQGAAFWHCLFIPVLFFLLLFTPPASRAFHRAPEVALFVCVALAAVWLLVVDSGGRGGDSSVGRFAAGVAWYLVYMALGAWFGARRELTRSWGRTAGGAMVVAWIVLRSLAHMNGLALDPYGAPLDWPVVALGVLGLSVVFDRLRIDPASLQGRAVRSLAPLTLGVYLAHPLVQEVIRLNAPAADLPWLGTSYLMDAATYFVVAVVSFGGMSVLSRLPGLSTLAGARR